MKPNLSADMDFRLPQRGLSVSKSLGVPWTALCVNKLDDNNSVRLQGVWMGRLRRRRL